MVANDKQVAGEHYQGEIQPWDAIIAWELGFLDGCAVKYLARWRKKGGVQDIMKAIHFLEKLVEVENDRLQRSRIEARKTAAPTRQTDVEARVSKWIRDSGTNDGRGQTAVERQQGADYRPTSLGDII